MKTKKYNFVNIIISIISIIVVIIVGYLTISSNKKIKSLEFIFITKISLLDIEEEIKDKIEIKYNKMLIKNLSKAKFSIKNSGDLPIISSKDVLQPILIQFPNDIQLIKNSINTFPSTIKADVKLDSSRNGIILSFDALDVNDIIEIESYYAGNLKSNPLIVTRILGLENKHPVFSEKYTISSKRESKISFHLSFIFGFIGSLFFIFMFLSYKYVTKEGQLFVNFNFFKIIFISIVPSSIISGFLVAVSGFSNYYAPFYAGIALSSMLNLILPMYIRSLRE